MTRSPDILHRPVAGGDFTQWIGQTLGLEALAAAIGRNNPCLGGLEEMRQETLRLIAAVLDSGLQDRVH